MVLPDNKLSGLNKEAFKKIEAGISVVPVYPVFYPCSLNCLLNASFMACAVHGKISDNNILYGYPGSGLLKP